MNQEIETLLRNRAEAVKAKDVEKAATFYRESLRVFDLVEPLERRGKSGISQRLNEWFSSFEEIQDYSFSGLEVHLSGTLAVCSLFNHVKAIKSGQPALDMWWRETLAMEKSDNGWLIIHTHSSVPFNPASGMAAMGLKP